MLEKDIKKVLFSQEDIVAKTKELGQQLTKDYEGKELYILHFRKKLIRMRLVKL